MAHDHAVRLFKRRQGESGSNSSLMTYPSPQWTVLQGFIHRGHEMNHTVAGVSSLSSRLQELTMRFQAKLLLLHADYPIQALLYPTPILSNYNASFYSLIPFIPLHREYLQLSNAHPPWAPLTFIEFIRNCKLHSYATAKSILPRSILSDARDNALVDISLRIRNPKI